ncbi:unnamed protein product [Moneuplotes crassus]|uniref:Uncharacterized protein n=1 Tax=Euplotes crassus TaxID=5936 RepID=A0AAD1UG73_EUPCR|nr:unnamed protein product [Moneuplotes crassus]
MDNDSPYEFDFDEDVEQVDKKENGDFEKEERMKVKLGSKEGEKDREEMDSMKQLSGVKSKELKEKDRSSEKNSITEKPAADMKSQKSQKSHKSEGKKEDKSLSSIEDSKAQTINKKDNLKLPPQGSTSKPKRTKSPLLVNKSKSAYPSLLGGKHQARFDKGEQGKDGQTDLKTGKFFKNRKLSHSKRRSGEKETLYEESMKLKILNNTIKEENLKYKTQMQILENELEKRDQLMEDVILSLNKNLKCSECVSKDPASPVDNNKLMAILKSSLTNTLKKQVKDLRQELSELNKEKKEKKYTKINEVTTELEVMQEECTRLRGLLEESLKAKPQPPDENIDHLQEQLDEKDALIKQMESDNVALAQALQSKDDLAEKAKNNHSDLKEKYDKQKKLLAAQKKTKKKCREYQKEILKLKKEAKEEKSKHQKYKEEVNKKMKDKDSEIHSLKQQLSYHKNKPAQNVPSKDLQAVMMASKKKSVSPSRNTPSPKPVVEENKKIEKPPSEIDESIGKVSSKKSEKNIEEEDDDYSAPNSNPNIRAENNLGTPVSSAASLKSEQQPKDSKKEDFSEVESLKEDSPKRESPKIRSGEKKSSKGEPRKASASKQKKKDEEEKSSSPSKAKKEKRKPISELSDALAQLRCKLNEYGIGIPELIDTIIFTNNAKEVSISCETLAKRLQSFMAYSAPQEIDQLCVEICDGENKTSRDLLTKSITRDLRFKKFDQNTNTQLKIIELIENYRETFDAAIEFEEDHEGCFTISGLKEALTTVDLLLSEQQYDFLIWLLYQETKDVRKLKNIKLVHEEVAKNVSLSSIKEEKSSKDGVSHDNSPVKHHAVEERFSPKEDSHSVSDVDGKEDDDGDDEYSGFEDPKDQESDRKPKKSTASKEVKKNHEKEEENQNLDFSDDEPEIKFQKKNSESSVKFNETDDQIDELNNLDKESEYKYEEPEKSLDSKLSDKGNMEDIINIAEEAYAKIAQGMLLRNENVSTLFKGNIKATRFGDEEIEYIAYEDFENTIKNSNVAELSSDELNAALRITKKDGLDNKIKASDLKDILSNFGVNEFDRNGVSNTIEDDMNTETEDPRKKKKRQLDFEKLSKESLKILAIFTDYLLDTDTSVYEFFDGSIYDQIVRTKNKQNTVEIISSENFFTQMKVNEQLMDLLRANEVSEFLQDETCIKNISEFLCLDHNYTNLLMIKKVIKALEELSHN